MNRSLFAFHKVAGLAPSEENQEFLDNHFAEHNSDKWGKFKSRLKSKDFVSAVKQDPRSDGKLKRFSEMLGKHMTAKTTEVIPGSSGSSYKVKYHPEMNRYSCSCGDWTYNKSVKRSGDRDCKHIKELKNRTETTKQAMRGRAAAAMLRELKA